MQRNSRRTQKQRTVQRKQMRQLKALRFKLPETLLQDVQATNEALRQRRYAQQHAEYFGRNQYLYHEEVA